MTSDSVVYNASQFALHMMLPCQPLEYTVFGYILSRMRFINREFINRESEVGLHPIEQTYVVSTGEIVASQYLLNECTSTV